MAYDLLITNGVIVNASGILTADVAVVGERIAEVAPNLSHADAGRVIDAAGRMVMPGGIDVHVHLDMPVDHMRSSDDFESGTIAAAFGGTTAIIDFANQSTGRTLRSAVEEWQERARGKAVIDYGLHCTIADFSPRVLEEMDELVADGITSFKVFTAYPGRLMLDDGAIFRIMQQAAKLGALVCVHAENGPIIDVLAEQAIARGEVGPRFHALTRPVAAEAEAVHRMIAMAEMAIVPVYVVHVSCRESVAEIATAQERGIAAIAETCPQYLFLSIDDVNECGSFFDAAKYVFTPPPRERFHQDALWNGLAHGTVSVVSTDHCPFNFRGQKDRGHNDFRLVPNGAPGIEHRLSLLYTEGVVAGRFSPNRFVELVSTNPARYFGLFPRKGIVARGSDADLLIWNPIRTDTISARTHHMRVDYSAYEGRTVCGTPEVVIANGKVIVENGAFHGRAGAGRFLRRARFSSAS